MTKLENVLAAFPREPLIETPTPIQRLYRLAKARRRAFGNVRVFPYEEVTDRERLASQTIALREELWVSALTGAGKAKSGVTRSEAKDVEYADASGFSDRDLQ